MKTLFLIPARGGSKGVPKKNIKALAGNPLISYSIEVAREFVDDKDICVSTDSDEIKATVEGLGLKVPFIRPQELSSDQAGTREVILHALEFYEKLGINYSTVALLQPTSPFRTKDNVGSCLSLYNEEIDMVVSVKESKANPYYLLFEEDKNGFLFQSKKGKFTRRQEVPKVYEINGAVYVINVDSIKSSPISEFKKVRKMTMNEIHSIDIDTPFDWHICEMIIDKNLLGS